MSKVLAIALESVGISIIVAGIMVEAFYGADLGYILISGGSAAIAGGSLIFAKLLRK